MGFGSFLSGLFGAQEETPADSGNYFGLGYNSPYGKSAFGLGDLFGGGSSSDSFGGLGGIAPYITGITDLLGIGGQLYQNNQNLQQSSDQWDAQFQYQQQRDQANDQLAKDELAAKLQAAGMAAGATKAAAAIAAGAQNKRTLADMYANYLNDLGGVRKDQLAGFGQLASAMADPYLRRRG